MPKCSHFSTSLTTVVVSHFCFHKSHPHECEVVSRCGFDLHFPNESCRRRWWHPTPVLLPGKSHGQRRLEGHSPWGRWGSDTTEQLHFHFSLSYTGKGNGNPLQCFCLENPRDGGAWWAAIYGVAQSQIRLKRLSSRTLSKLLMSYLFYTSSINMSIPVSLSIPPTPLPH